MFFSREELYNNIQFINNEAVGVGVNIFDEAVNAQVMDSVLDKMFALTITKYNKINFNEIEMSRGDITKFKYYNAMDKCIEELMEINTSTGKLPNILAIYEAQHNLLDMKNVFQYNFKTKNNCAIMVYNSIVYIIMEALSYTIAASIDFINNNDQYAVNINSTKDDALINILIKFNKAIADGSLLKFINKANDATLHESTILDYSEAIKVFIKNNKKILIDAGIIAGLIIVGLNIIPILREAIYWIYKTKHTISECAKVQAEYLKLNIHNIEDNTMYNKNKTDKIISKQNGYIKMFEKISRVFAINSDKTTRDAKLDIASEKINASNIVI